MGIRLNSSQLLPGELYKESLNKNDKNRFWGNFWECDNSQWGVLPRKKVESLEVKNLEFELKIEKNQFDKREVFLRSLKLELVDDGEEGFPKPSKYIYLQFWQSYSIFKIFRMN